VGSIIPAHEFCHTHECVLRSIEVVHSLLHIQYWKKSQDIHENKVELLEKLEIVMGGDAVDWDVGEYSLGGIEYLLGDQDLRLYVCRLASTHSRLTSIFPSVISTLVIEIAYGLDTKSHEEKPPEALEHTIEYAERFMVPGGLLVDMFPMRSFCA